MNIFREFVGKLDATKTIPVFILTGEGIVRCKDCKHYLPGNGSRDGWCNVEMDRESGIGMKPEGFCSRGEYR